MWLTLGSWGKGVPGPGMGGPKVVGCCWEGQWGLWRDWGRLPEGWSSVEEAWLGDWASSGGAAAGPAEAVRSTREWKRRQTDQYATISLTSAAKVLNVWLCLSGCLQRRFSVQGSGLQRGLLGRFDRPGRWRMERWALGRCSAAGPWNKNSCITNRDCAAVFLYLHACISSHSYTASNLELILFPGQPIRL